MSPSQESSKNVVLPAPFLQVEGILNCRGVPLPSDPSSSRHAHSLPPWLLRSGDISHITSRGIEQLRAFGVGTIFDLRSPSDIVKFRSPVPEIAGVEIVKAPLVLDQNVETGEEVKEGAGVGRYDDESMRKVYADFRADELGTFMVLYTGFLEEGRESVSKILRTVSERKKDEGFLFHCSAGKDRTGVIAALLLSLAGADDAVISNDYALTSAGLEPYSEMILSRFESDAAFQENPEGAMKMLSSRPETMHAFLKLLREKYGGVESYARDVAGLRDTEITKLKARLR